MAKSLTRNDGSSLTVYFTLRSDNGLVDDFWTPNEFGAILEGLCARSVSRERVGGEERKELTDEPDWESAYADHGSEVHSGVVWELLRAALPRRLCRRQLFVAVIVVLGCALPLCGWLTRSIGGVE